MAKAAAADDVKPVGVCEKLFNALSLNPSSRPVRRFTHRKHSPDAASRPPNSTQNTSVDDLRTGTSSKPNRRPPPATPAMISPAAPLVPVPVPVPPKAVVVQQAEDESEEKKNINERAAEFIKRAKIKIRSTTFGRTHTTKKTS